MKAYHFPWWISLKLVEQSEIRSIIFLVFESVDFVEENSGGILPIDIALFLAIACKRIPHLPVKRQNI